jgi:hypothetical protein
VGPSIRSNHNENTLLLREGELGHPEVCAYILQDEQKFMEHANTVSMPMDPNGSQMID